MKTNVEILEELGILGDIRQRLGGEDEKDNSNDERINKMSPDSLISSWCGWEFGDSSWWGILKNYYDTLTKETSKQ